MPNDLQPQKLHSLNRMCGHAWGFAVVNLFNGQFYMCCKTKPVIPSSQDILSLPDDVFVNHSSFVERRTALLRGEAHNDCSSCWSSETAGLRSMRMPLAESMRQLSDAGAVVFDSETKTSQVAVQMRAPDTLDLRVGRVCNLKCVYCSPEFSTEWERETKRFEGDSQIDFKLSVHDLKNFEEKFWRWFSSAAPSIRCFIITGGEPILNAAFDTFVEKIHATVCDSPSVVNREARIFTNGMMNESHRHKMLSAVDRLSERLSVDLHFSFEAVGLRAEYIRHGLRWAQFEQNFRRFVLWASQPSVYPRRISVQMAHNCLSLPFVSELIDFVADLQEEFGVTLHANFNMVTHPTYLSLGVLTPELLLSVEEAIQKMKQRGVWSGFARALEKVHTSLSTAEADADLRQSFWHWANENDRRRESRILEAFPEYFSHSQEFGPAARTQDFGQ